MDDTAFSLRHYAGVEEQSPDEEQDRSGQWRGRRSLTGFTSRNTSAQSEGTDRGASRSHQGGHARPHRETDWMSPETKAQALAKLDAMRVKVAIPTNGV